jgi:prepilin-type processing-associated H-X9-DG protein
MSRRLVMGMPIPLHGSIRFVAELIVVGVLSAVSSGCGLNDHVMANGTGLKKKLKHREESEIKSRHFVPRPLLNRPRTSQRRGLTLIELLVIIAVCGIAMAFLLPAVQTAREAARRAQCTNNLKQIALSLVQYADVHGTLPIGSASQQGWPTGSFFLQTLPQLEAQPLYNIVNFSVNYAESQNATIHDARLSILVCPSDPDAYQQVTVDGVYAFELCPFPVKIRLTSYSGSAGLFYQYSLLHERLRQQNGLIVHRQTYSIASIFDGTSNTLLAGEHATGRLEERVRSEWHWWTSGYVGDTIFTALYPINPFFKMPEIIPDDNVGPYLEAASSMHPGGASFGFADGSVHWIKDTIDSWANDPQGGFPADLSYAFGLYFAGPKLRLGVYQMLATRNGGEVIAPESY